MAGAVADRIDVVECGAAIAVDVDPVRTRRAGGDQRTDRRHDADPRDHDIASDAFARIGHHTGHAAVLAFDRLDPGRKPQVDALLAVVGCVEFGQFRPGDAR